MNSDQFTRHPIYQKLRELMNDPRYWRQRDPAYIKMIQDGFEQLALAGQHANKAGLNGPLQAQDTEIAHVSPGEVIVPRSAQTPEVMESLSNEMGNDLAAYTVGSGAEQINPVSGLTAFADHADAMERDIERSLAGWASKSQEEQDQVRRKIMQYQRINPGKAMTYLGRIGYTQINPKAEWTTFDDERLIEKKRNFEQRNKYLDEAALAAGIMTSKSPQPMTVGAALGTYGASKWADWQNEEYKKHLLKRR